MQFINKAKKYYIEKKKKTAMKKYLERYINLSQFLMINGKEIDLRYVAGDLIYTNDVDQLQEFVVNNLKKHNIYGFTVMMYASIKEDDQFLDMAICSSLGSVNTSDCYGYTALMYACRFNRRSKVVQVLLKNGADANRKSKDGRTALDFAKENGNYAIITLVGRAMLNRSIQLVTTRETTRSSSKVKFNSVVEVLHLADH